MSLKKAILVGHVINQGRKINGGTHAKKDRPKKMLRRCYVLADVIIFVYDVPCIFWHYINVDKLVSWIKKIIKKCDGIITNCDSFFIKKCDTVYYELRLFYKVRWLLQIATVLLVTRHPYEWLLPFLRRHFARKPWWRREILANLLSTTD